MHWIEEIMARVDRFMNAVDKAKALGTYNAVDRSQQYARVDNAELLRAVNEAWNKIRQLEAAGLRKDADIAELRKRVKRYRIANTVLISIITGLAWEGVRFLGSILGHYFF